MNPTKILQGKIGELKQQVETWRNGLKAAEARKVEAEKNISERLFQIRELEE